MFLSRHAFAVCHSHLGAEEPIAVSFVWLVHILGMQCLLTVPNRCKLREHLELSIKAF